MSRTLELSTVRELMNACIDASGSLICKLPKYRLCKLPKLDAVYGRSLAALDDVKFVEERLASACTAKSLGELIDVLKGEPLDPGLREAARLLNRYRDVSYKESLRLLHAEDQERNSGQMNPELESLEPSLKTVMAAKEVELIMWTEQLCTKVAQALDTEGHRGTLSGSVPSRELRA